MPRCGTHLHESHHARASHERVELHNPHLSPDNVPISGGQPRNVVVLRVLFGKADPDSPLRVLAMKQTPKNSPNHPQGVSSNVPNVTVAPKNFVQQPATQ